MITQNKASQDAMTASAALESLLEGNKRFLAGQMTSRNLMEQVQGTSTGQWPFAVVLGCIDSRAAPELIFDQGIGDVFSVRVAGNVVNEDALGSMEFACKAAGAKLVMVLGHTACGAVKGACDGVELGNLTGTLAKIKRAVDKTPEPADASQRTSANATFVDSVAHRNVLMVRDEVLERSDVLRAMSDDGSIDVVAAVYDVGTGAVELCSPDA